MFIWQSLKVQISVSETFCSFQQNSLNKNCTYFSLWQFEGEQKAKIWITLWNSHSAYAKTSKEQIWTRANLCSTFSSLRRNNSFWLQEIRFVKKKTVPDKSIFYQIKKNFVLQRLCYLDKSFQSEIRKLNKHYTAS